MSLDQANRLRQLVRASGTSDVGNARALPMVVVSGGKGGVGVSTIAMQVAMAVSRFGRRALLVEADLDRGGHVEQACDGASIADCIAGRVAVRDAIEPGPDGIWVLPGAWAPCDFTNCTATAQDRLIDEMRTRTIDADMLIVDVGSSRNHFVRRFWRAASMVVMVTTPDDTAVTDAYAAIKVLLAGETSVPVYTLVNYAIDGTNSLFVHERVRATCKRFLGLRTAALGDVPRLAPVSEISSEPAFGQIAGSLCEELGLSAANRTIWLAA